MHHTPFPHQLLPSADGLFHALEILDTAGSHHFPAMRELSIRSGRAFVVVFAVNNEQSFYEAQTLWDLIVELKGELLRGADPLGPHRGAQR